MLILFKIKSASIYKITDKKSVEEIISVGKLNKTEINIPLIKKYKINKEKLLKDNHCWIAENRLFLLFIINQNEFAMCVFTNEKDISYPIEIFNVLTVSIDKIMENTINFSEN